MPDSNTPDLRSKRSLASVAACLVAVALLVAADLGSKAWATEHLSRARFVPNTAVCQPDASGYVTPARVAVAPKVVVPSFFELRYAENCGAAFGILNSTNSIYKKLLFVGAALVATAYMMVRYRQGQGGRWFVLAAATVSAGAIGNLSDRARLGYVVDFIRFYVGKWEYPTFNVADVYISVGVVAILVDGFLEDRQLRRLEAAQRAQGDAAPSPTAAAADAPSATAAEVAPADEPSSTSGATGA